MVKIAVDTMGGDNGSKIVVTAIKDFLKKHKDVEIIAVGKEEELIELKGLCEIVDARDVVPMTAGALEVLRMRNSSMVKAISLVKEGKAEAVVSCGSTGGFLSASTITLKMIPGVKRAALVTGFPVREKGKYLTVLDCGANIENSAEELTQFALMGRLYSKASCGIENPSVYLLCNGAEDEKGTNEIKEANKMLRQSNFPNFGGNIEAREAIMNQDVDVVVANGFNGNIFLKTAEGTAKFITNLLKESFKTNILTMIGYVFSKKGINKLKNQLDYKAIGGALLLGVNGVVVKGHGNSDAYSFNSALKVAYKMVKDEVVNHIKEGIVVNE